MDARPQLVRGYTIALGIFAVVFVFGAISMYSNAESPGVDPSMQWAFALAARMGLATAALCALVAVLRARRSEFAYPATAVFNLLLFLYIPFGTAATLYWWFRIRAREKTHE